MNTVEERHPFRKLRTIVCLQIYVDEWQKLTCVIAMLS